MTTFLCGKELVDKVIENAINRKAENIIALDLSDSASVAQWVVICQGDNTVHNKAIANEIIVELKKDSTPPWYVEGNDNGRWILIDYSDVVVHIMLPEIREYYKLEDLWENTKKVEIDS